MKNRAKNIKFKYPLLCFLSIEVFTNFKYGNIKLNNYS